MTVKRGMQRRNNLENGENKLKRSKRLLEVDEVVLDDNHSAENSQVEESKEELDFDAEFDFFNDLNLEELELPEEDFGEDEDMNLPEEDFGEDEDVNLPEEDFDEDEEQLEVLHEDDIISQFKPCNVPNKTRQVTATGSGVTIVKANTGNRIVLNNSIVSALGITTDIQFGYSESSSQLMIGKDLPDDFAKYNVKLQKNQSAIVYNKNLVTAIVSNFGLDFTNCTSQIFSSWTVVTQNDLDIVLVDIC